MAVIHLQFDTNSTLDVTWQKVAFSSVEIGETDGILTVAVAYRYTTPRMA